MIFDTASYSGDEELIHVYIHTTIIKPNITDYNPGYYYTAGAPKLGLWRERPHSAAGMMYLRETLTVKLFCLEGLVILVSKGLVFLSRIGSVRWVW